MDILKLAAENSPRSKMIYHLGICRTSLAVSALRIMRYCLNVI